MTAQRSVKWGAGGPTVSRRGFLVGAAGVVAAAGGVFAAAETVFKASSGAAGASRRAVSMAMHVHASASEGPGSMEAQLDQATKNGIDVLWWTEHDQRMSAHAAPDVINFTGATETPATPALAAPWTWTPSSSGPVATANHEFLTQQSSSDISPHDAALRVSVQAAGSGQARHMLDGQAQNTLNRTCLAGMSISLDVHPIDVGSSAFLSLEIISSYRPQAPGLPAGEYRLSYRIGGGRTPGTSHVVNDTMGVVALSAPVGRWTTVTIQPEQDIVRLWQGTDGRDAALYKLSVAASATTPGSRASGYFASLKFTRQDAGQLPLERQRDLMLHYADRYSTVRQLQALEVSLTVPHLGWYGGKPTLQDTSSRPPLPIPDDAYARSMISLIHGSGGLASYCHPFGTSVELAPAVDQETARVAKSEELVRNHALGCDLLEVGYRERGGCGLPQHESVWDNCSRNGIYLTGLGTNDDHVGQDWLHAPLNFLTWVWAPDTSEAAVLAALRGGEAFFGDLAKFHGRLDLRVDGRAAMGAIRVSTDDKTAVDIVASNIGSDDVVDVVRGTVDFAGPNNVNPEIAVATFRASDLKDGTAVVNVDTTSSRFVRLVVKDRTGLKLAFSNPLWLLRSAPPGGVPLARALSGRTR